MSTLLDEPLRQSFVTPAAQRLRTTMAAVRVSMSWLGTKKSLTAEQKAEAAEPFGTDARFLSAGKRLLDIAQGPTRPRCHRRRLHQGSRCPASLAQTALLMNTGQDSQLLE